LRGVPEPEPEVEVDPRFAQTQDWPADTLVLRAGEATVERLLKTGDDPDFPGEWAFSVQAHPGATVERLLVGNDGEPWFRYGKYRVTTLGDVRAHSSNPARCLAESPVPDNDYHCNVVGLTPEVFESILSRPPSENPLRARS
jgi:hypothetical protein